MIIPRTAKYVMDMLNIGYLTGFSRHIDKIPKDTWHKKVYGKDWHGVLIQQTNNVEQAIPVHFPSHIRLPDDRAPVTVAFHVFGERDSDGDQTLYLSSIGTSRPSARAIPPSAVWAATANEKYSDGDDFRPYGQDGSLIKELRQSVDEKDEYNDAELVLQAMLLANKGRLDTRNGSNSNVVAIAGFLEAASAFTPTADDFQQNPYWSLLIRQHKDKRACLPVRLYTPTMRAFRDSLRRAAPYLIMGQVRVKVMPNEDGSVKKALLYIRTDDVSGASRATDILTVPEWFSELRMELVKEREAAMNSKAAQPEGATV